MSKKSLWVLVLVLVALGALLWWQGRQEAQPVAASAQAATAPLLAGVDWNGLTTIMLADGVATTHLAKVDGNWTVVEQDGYPADVNRLRQMLRSLDDLAAGEVVAAATDDLTEFGLVPAGDSPPTRLLLEQDGRGSTLWLGNMRAPKNDMQMWMRESGRYVRVNDGPVRLIKDSMARISTTPDEWWERQIVAVEPADVDEVAVTAGDESYTIARDDTGVYAVRDGADGETVDDAAAERLFGLLLDLRADTLLSAERVAELEFAPVATYRAKTADATYTVEISDALADENNGWPLRLTVTAPNGEPPAAHKSAGRTYLVAPYIADQFKTPRGVLVKAAPEPEEAAEVAAGEEPAENAEESADETPAEIAPPPVPDAAAEEPATPAESAAEAAPE